MNGGGGGLVLTRVLPRLRHVPELLTACGKARRTWLLAEIYSPFTPRRIH